MTNLKGINLLCRCSILVKPSHWKVGMYCVISLIAGYRVTQEAATYWLKYCKVPGEVLSRHNPCPAHQTSCQVVYDVAIEIGCYHDVKLMWVGYQLHAGVVNDHGLKRDLGVEGRDLTTAL